MSTTTRVAKLRQDGVQKMIWKGRNCLTRTLKIENCCKVGVIEDNTMVGLSGRLSDTRNLCRADTITSPIEAYPIRQLLANPINGMRLSRGCFPSSLSEAGNKHQSL